MVINGWSTPSGVYVLGQYAVGSYKRSRGSEFARRLMQLKHGNDQAVEYFAARLASQVEAGQVIVPVPSSRVKREHYGVDKLARRLCELTDAIDGTGCLERVSNIPRMALGGPRGEGIHFASIEVRLLDRFTGRDVILLDDVTTTGASIRACKFLLLNAGAAQVMPVVVAQAVRLELM